MKAGLSLQAARRALYEAVANQSKGCLFIDADNNKQGQILRLNVDQVATTNRAFCVELAPGVVAIDYDEEDGVSLADAMRCADELETEGHKAVVLTSGRDRNAHLFVSVDEADVPKVRELTKRFGGDDRTNKRIRPPLSPHRLGYEPILCRPGSLSEAIKRLSGPETRRAPKRAVGSPSETVFVRRLLAEDVGKGHRSERLFHLACAYHRAGLTEEDYVCDVLAHPEGAGAKLMGMRRERREGYLRGRWEKAANAENRPSSGPIVERIKGMREAARRASWPSARWNVLPMLEAIHAKAAELGRLEVAMSVRDAAELTGTTRATANNNLRRLVQTGWLTVASFGNAMSATTYRLACPMNVSWTLTSTPIPTPFGCAGVFTLRALGDALWRKPHLKQALMFLAERSEPATVAELAKAMNRSYQATRNALNGLAAYGLARRDDGRWCAMDHADLDELAKQRGTFGRTERLERDHRREREDWARHLVEVVCTAPKAHADWVRWQVPERYLTVRDYDDRGQRYRPKEPDRVGTSRWATATVAA